MAERKLFDELMEAVGAMRDHRQGKLTLRSYQVEAEPLPAVLTKARRTRRRLRMVVFLFCVVLAGWPSSLLGQEYSVRAVDAKTGKALADIPITLRYDCTFSGAGMKLKSHCKFIQRRTGTDGIAHFPEAGSLPNIDDIFSLPITYGAVCCDITNPTIPGTGTIKFERRSLGETLHWIFIGD